jgi:hypothetical protein
MLGNAAINAKLSRSLGLTIKEIAKIVKGFQLGHRMNRRHCGCNSRPDT